MNHVRTRFAPSPTGFLHIGGVRTAMYAFALAKRHGGQFLLRVEDTDQTRFVEGAEDVIFSVLDQFGLTPDESDRHGGDKGPYRQSDRLDIYKKYAEQLVEQGDAFYSFESKEELAEHRRVAEANKERFAYRSPYRDLPLEEAKKRIAAGDEYVIRQKMPAGQGIIFEDALQGTMKFTTDDVDDGILLKSDGFPTYHLAVVVDDHLMEVSHVFRGVEWIPSIPKHVLLYKAFGWEMPVFAHLSLILDPGGGKLSKRKGAVAADEFLKEGYLPQALLNFLMLLGWSSPQEREHGESEREFFSMQDFVEQFDISDLNKSSPVFNREKLLWFNQQYLQQLSPDLFVRAFTDWVDHYGDDETFKQQLVAAGPEKVQNMLVLEQTRVKTLAEIPATLQFYFNEPGTVSFAEVKQLKNLTDEQVAGVYRDFLAELSRQESVSSWGHEAWEQSVRTIAERHDVKAGSAFMALRIAVTGSPFSPPLFEVMEILQKDTIQERIQRYL
ncbi:MAG: Glutamate--tRNA ligase [candidate division WS6 bacterium OLB20]|uniref:Glutamate--tRNA ligase n=1 Tax=candidate division WS6 bacterium OLB20 TaxID=1617426 RepID=A0A136LZJ4_9BACT|nr:MAG: Glutamate--tRNA ligase [candidate division WS6 bacterium OLB20]